MVKLTERAAEHVRQVAQSRSMPETTMLRVEIQPHSAPDQPQVSLRLDPNEPRPDDAVEATKGVRIAVKKDLANSLGDGELDYVEDTGAFVFARK